ncbi:MAG: HAD family hydrolase [candidate division Zixibacteria bacterium]|nr:HAD family hydrolase [candidate division Zixibacteria bacterium]
MEKLKPKAVIFDLGSTLIDYLTDDWFEVSYAATQSAHQQFQDSGHSLPDFEEFWNQLEEVKQFYRDRAQKEHQEWTIVEAVSDMFKVLEFDNNGHLAREFFDLYYKVISEKLYIYDDTIETLNWIKERVEKIGLISNTFFPEEKHLEELDRFKIAPFLDYKIFSSTFGLRKPHPDIFSKAVELAGFEPSECVYIGDRYVEDITGPANIGMPAILKKIKGREYPEEMPQSTRQISTLSELKNHLDI